MVSDFKKEVKKEVEETVSDRFVILSRGLRKTQAMRNLESMVAHESVAEEGRLDRLEHHYQELSSALSSTVLMLPSLPPSATSMNQQHSLEPKRHLDNSQQMALDDSSTHGLSRQIALDRSHAGLLPQSD